MADLDPTLTGTWVFDPAHTRVGFSARHAMVTTVRGTFTEVQGTIHLDADDIAGSRVEVRIQASSINTHNEQRDEHLRSIDFFHVEQFPEIVFVSSTVDEVEENNFMVVGDLTIKDVTKQMAIPIALLGVQRDPMGNLRAGFEASRRIDRRDFGLHWNMPLDAGGLLVSEKVSMEFEISAIKQEG